jgi:hypothetical protein
VVDVDFEVVSGGYGEGVVVNDGDAVGESDVVEDR